MDAKSPTKPDVATLISHVIDLPREMPTVLGMGAYLKASLCLIDGQKAYITRDAGDLGSLEAVEDYQVMLRDLTSLAWHDITCVAHDLHPNFHSTRQSGTFECPTLPVQHHHAHILATAGEHLHQGPVLGLALDGFGLGAKGGSWGGELLLVDGLDYARLGHLSELARGDEIVSRFAAQPHAEMLLQMLEKGLNCPPTSSCGRLFDAACGLLNVLPVSEFEGQAPMALEALADAPEVMPEGWQIKDGILDFLPLLSVLPGMEPRAGANLFHGTLAAGLTNWIQEAAQESGVTSLAIGGGCFFNKVMTENLMQQLALADIRVLQPIQLSPGDAGLSFGQAIAAALSVEQQA